MSDLHPTTVILQRELIRLAKGMLTAWENWLKARSK
jgi:hypothetical protein